jgi:hypothetical protein
MNLDAGCRSSIDDIKSNFTFSPGLKSDCPVGTPVLVTVTAIVF